MAGFYYFFRGRSPDDVARGEELNHNLLAEYGLAEVLADVRKVPAHAAVSNVGSNAGPGGSCGTVLTINSKYTGAPHLVGNWPDRQHWMAADPEKGLWIGVLKHELPRPEELERFSVIYGPEVIDPQHYAWRIPIARLVAQQMPYGTLPQSYRFSADGEPQPVLDKAYEWLWQLAGEIKDYYAADGKSKPHGWIVKQVARLLGVNYRVGIHELNLLHDLGRPVLHQTTIGPMAQTSYGYELIEEAKKNEPPVLTEANPPS